VLFSLSVQFRSRELLKFKDRRRKYRARFRFKDSPKGRKLNNRRASKGGTREGKGAAAGISRAVMEGGTSIRIRIISTSAVPGSKRS
jgi:hypothetical protein